MISRPILPILMLWTGGQYRDFKPCTRRNLRPSKTYRKINSMDGQLKLINISTDIKILYHRQDLSYDLAWYVEKTDMYACIYWVDLNLQNLKSLLSNPRNPVFIGKSCQKMLKVNHKCAVLYFLYYFTSRLSLMFPP